MKNISKHVSYKEGVRSNTALRLGIENTPGAEQLEKMEIVAKEVFEPLREWVGGPIKVNSFFRGEKLNKAVGGSTKSQHMSGQAMDIDDGFGHRSNADMYGFIKENLNFDQMIWEFGDDENPDWVHVSFVSKEENRNRCLKAYKEKGRTKYKVI
jgi:zinc D-Ala-D-Ala carboxypeptidase|tara:strand:+ start:42 stop:503 length:462 start_codon:yes stop_codon:yes gene_type:complete